MFLVQAMFYKMTTGGVKPVTSGGVVPGFTPPIFDVIDDDSMQFNITCKAVITTFCFEKINTN